jgi:hypothetical protein
MKTFPDKSLFNLDLTDQECEGFTDGIQELRKTGLMKFIFSINIISCFCFS